MLKLGGFLVILASGLVLGAPRQTMENRIVGGRPAKVGEFPHMVSLRMLINDIPTHVCGGSILNQRTILTAAHCINGIPPANITIKAGTNLINGLGQIYYAVEYKIHESFQIWVNINDIALLKTDREIQMSDVVKPIALYNSTLHGDESVILSGWGTTNLNGATPNELQAIDLKTITNEECINLINIQIFPTEICTFTKHGEGPCHGDSGGPLIKDGKQVGIVSWGRPCANGFPDVYSKVLEFIDWIIVNMYK